MAAFWEDFLGVVRSIGPYDILDILVVSYLFYEGIKLVRETRAVQLVKGLGALLLLYFMARLLEMKTTSFIMTNLLQIGAVALLVVFQPELRRALEQVGRTRFSGLSLFAAGGEEAALAHQWRQAALAISEGCEALSAQKIGALIVIERETKLGEIIKTGTVVDAKPSSELLGNIFFPNSPLHDGALIVRDGRLCAAGCFLPLSQNYGISKQLGTRHRAALGMSENSDAVVVVVSEETGAISVAVNGVLKRHYTQAELYSELCSSLQLEKLENAAEKRGAFWKVKR